MKRHLRLKVLTYRRVQLRLVGVVLVCLLLFVAFFVVLYMSSVASTSSRTKDIGIQDQLVTQMLLVEQSKDMAILYGFAGFVFIILICMYLIIYSNRLTGPIYKLTKHLESAVQNKELPKPIQFRKDDAFKELASAFNKFLQEVQIKK